MGMKCFFWWFYDDNYHLLASLALRKKCSIKRLNHTKHLTFSNSCLITNFQKRLSIAVDYFYQIFEQATLRNTTTEQRTGLSGSLHYYKNSQKELGVLGVSWRFTCCKLCIVQLHSPSWSHSKWPSDNRAWHFYTEGNKHAPTRQSPAGG